MTRLEVKEGAVRFLYQGQMPQLIHELNGMQWEDLTVTEPSLDEIFLHFYDSEQKG